MDVLSEDGLISDRIRGERAIQPTSIDPPFPRTACFELSNLCNHACVFCAYPKMTRKGRRINVILLKRLMREAYDLGTREAAFHSGAEPFMSPDLEEDIRLAKQIGYEDVFISTNGSLATESRLQACIDYGLDSIKFSINAADRETYRRVHGNDISRIVMKGHCATTVCTIETPPFSRSFPTWLPRSTVSFFDSSRCPERPPISTT